MKNKKVVGICLLGMLLLLASCAQEKRFRLEGRVDTRYNDSLVTLFTFLGNRIRSVDSTYVADGRFRFEGLEYLYEESLVSLGNYPDSVFSVGLFLCEGDIEVELKRQPVVRSQIMDEYKAFEDSSRVLYARTFAANEAERKAVSKAEWKRRLDEHWRFRFEFKKKHLGDGLGRKLFAEDMSWTDEPYSGELYKMMSERDRNRPDVKGRYQYWKKVHAQASMKGKPCPDFVLVDSLGQSHRISDYIGKHKLLFLDFWASWCGPCRRLEPKMKEMLKKYGDRGFDILGISIDHDKNAWLKALREDKRNWQDLCIATAEDEKELRDKFLITGIPHGVFVDQNGKIVVITSAAALQYVLENYYGEETEFPMDLYKN